jgi:nucleotide-binding universal stress UspA family protein
MNEPALRQDCDTARVKAHLGVRASTLRLTLTKRNAAREKEVGMFDRIVVPLDGSELAEQALPQAEELARLTGAPIHLVRVIDPTQLPWYRSLGMATDYVAVEGALRDEDRESDTYLNSVAKRLAESGIEVDWERRRGRTDRELIAATKPGDIIVMVSHGRGGITRVLLGSVAEELLRHASVPILLVKSTAVATNQSGNASETVANEGTASRNTVAGDSL